MKSELNFKVIKNDGQYDMHDLDIWVESFHIHSPENDLSLIKVQGMDGAHLEGSQLEVRRVDISLLVTTDSLEELDDLKHIIYNIFISKEPYKIIRDFKNLELYAMQSGSYDIENITCSDGTFDIELVMLDTYLYGPEETIKLEDISTIENKGTAPADPIFELTAKEKATFAMISNGADEDAEYNLIGTPVDVDEEVVDSKNQIFVEYGETLEEWKDPGSEFDNGKVTGDQLGFDGTGIHPLSYGDPGDWDKWYGPALMREINPIQDFEVEMRLRVNTSKPNELYRIEFYLYDENMNEIGKMAIRDFSLTVQRYAAEGRIGEFKGAGENYLISQENYLREASHFHGLVRMRRVGNEFEFYAARLKTGDDEYGKHHDIIRVPFRDKDNEYQGKLKYVQINIARHAQGSRASVPRINSIRVNELMEEMIDKTPYILYPEDVVTFDHKNEDILINGEPRNDLKNFGGSFFKLKKGENELIVTPAGVFDSKVIYADKYL